MHVKTAESVYLNGGKISIGAKQRQSRFYNNEFVSSSFTSYKNQKKCCILLYSAIGCF